MGYFERFYYDVATQKCQLFIYGGCQGNKNRFNTLEECNAACGKQVFHIAMQTTYLEKYHYTQSQDSAYIAVALF